MKISVVTISFNQAEFLEACLASVATQEGPWEHIIVDPGSTDGSREIIERYRDQFSQSILEPDRGPADGLNRGFEKATGEIFYYLNSDDVVLEGAFSKARAAFKEKPRVDVLSGNGVVIDENGQSLRYVYSDPVSRHRLAYAGGIRIQPATFIKAEAFRKVDGFNPENRSNWDGELIVDLFLAGATFDEIDEVLGGYRLHSDSITGTARLDERIREWALRKHEKLMGYPAPAHAPYIGMGYAALRVLRHPDTILARLRGRRVYGAHQ